MSRRKQSNDGEEVVPVQVPVPEFSLSASSKQRAKSQVIRSSKKDSEEMEVVTPENDAQDEDEDEVQVTRSTKKDGGDAQMEVVTTDNEMQGETDERSEDEVPVHTMGASQQEQ